MDMMKIEEYEELLGNPRNFIEKCCYITDKDAKFGLLKLNYPQEKLMRIVEKCLREKKPIRIRILKARQMGFSTLISALGFWWASMNENSAYAVVAHKDSSASSIFEKNKIFYDNLPKQLRPMTNRFNSEKISFNTPGQAEYEAMTGLRSKIFFGTAGGGELFRGETILFLHKSEVAFWEDKTGTLKKSLNATVPLSPFTAIIEETTANGYNEFKDDWDRSVRGEDDYIPLFVGWNEMVEYKMTPPPDFELNDTELALQMEYDLTDAQLYWRRYKINNDYGGNELWFKQEYPLTPEEAFIASGSGVFDGETISRGYKRCTKPVREIQLQSVMVREKLMIWEDPEEKTVSEYEQLTRWNDAKQEYEYYDGTLEVAKKTYVANYTVGVDTSGMGSNWNIVAVWHNIAKKLVACFCIKRLSEELLAQVVVEIAKYYNNALIAAEVNYSHAIYDYMSALGYKNFYFTESMSRVDKKKESMEYGWATTVASKAPLISGLRAYLNEHPEAIPDKEFWYEAEYYLLEDAAKNIMNAAKGHFDDRIIANAIAYRVCCSFQAKQNYMIKTLKREEKLQNNGIIIGGSPDLIAKVKSNRLKKGVYSNRA
jgi:hypothetical protein